MIKIYPDPDTFLAVFKIPEYNPTDVFIRYTAFCYALLSYDYMNSPIGRMQLSTYLPISFTASLTLRQYTLYPWLLHWHWTIYSTSLVTSLVLGQYTVHPWLLGTQTIYSTPLVTWHPDNIQYTPGHLAPRQYTVHPWLLGTETIYSTSLVTPLVLGQYTVHPWLLGFETIYSTPLVIGTETIYSTPLVTWHRDNIQYTPGYLALRQYTVHLWLRYFTGIGAIVRSNQGCTAHLTDRAPTIWSWTSSVPRLPCILCNQRSPRPLVPRPSIIRQMTFSWLARYVHQSIRNSSDTSNVPGPPTLGKRKISTWYRIVLHNRVLWCNLRHSITWFINPWYEIRKLNTDKTHIHTHI